MAAGYQDLFLEKGTSFSTSLTLNDSYGIPYQLFGFTVASQAKRSYYTANTSITFSTAITDAANGVITLSANSATTSNLTPGTLVYDVIIKDTYNLVSRVLEGKVFVDPSVTITSIL
jgi:hypothetical protein